MKVFGTGVFTALVGWTVWCAAYGPPYNDAYEHIVHAAWLLVSR